MSFKKKLGNIQHKSCIAKTGAIKGTSREHFQEELSFEDGTENYIFKKVVTNSPTQGDLLVI